jgi:hypothetical protein
MGDSGAACRLVGAKWREWHRAGNRPHQFTSQSIAAKEAIRKAALEVYFAKNQVDASQKERDAAALLASQRAAAVETLQAQYQELLAAVARANQKVLQLGQVGLPC